MGAFKIFLVVFFIAGLLVNVSDSNPVKKALHWRDANRCKRFGEGAAFFVSLGVALGRLNEVIAVENYPVKQQYPHWTEGPLSSTTTSPPRTTPTPSPSRTPPTPPPAPLKCPEVKNGHYFEGIILANYDHPAFSLIPRTFFRFTLEPLPHTPEHTNCWNGEYMLLDADFIAAASPDATRNRVFYETKQQIKDFNEQLLRPVEDTDVSSRSFWGLTERINLGLDTIRSLNTRIDAEVGAANKVLHAMQRERFIARMNFYEIHYRYQRAGGYGIPPECLPADTLRG